MIWIEIVCDSCCDNTFGQIYTSNAVSKLKKAVKEAGWKTINGKVYCTKCQEKMKSNENVLDAIDKYIVKSEE